MGRKGALEIKMTSGKVLHFLSERPDSKAKLVVCERYLDKLFKSKHSDRKKEYRQQLRRFLLLYDFFQETEDGKKIYLSKQRYFHPPGCDRPIFRVQLFLSRFEEKLDFWKSDSMSNLAIF